MTKLYTHQQKTDALLLLEKIGANVQAISQDLNIPVRTLYAWRKEARIQAQVQQLSTKNALAAEQNLQQLQQNPNIVPPIEQSALGMTRKELARALQIEYVPSAYETIRKALLLHISNVQSSISENPDSAHVRALAVSSMLDDVLRLDALCRLEKPQVNIFKYEYKDGTYHDIPEWSNAVYTRADQAYNAVLRQARREYYALQGQDYDETRPTPPEGQEYTEIEEPTLAELAAMHFTAEDFVAEHTGILAYFLNRQQAQPRPAVNPAEHGFFDEDEEEDYTL